MKLLRGVLMVMYAICNVQLAESSSNVSSSNNTFRKEIPIALLIPKATEDGGCTRRIMQLAIRDINEKRIDMRMRNLTENYTIKGYFKEIGKTKRDAVNALHQLFTTSPIKLATVGVPYKEQNAFVVDYTFQSKLPYFSYTTEDLPVRDNFDSYIQISTFIREQFHAAASFMKKHSWKSYSMIFDLTERRYDGANVIFTSIMKSNQLEALTVEEIFTTSREDDASTQVSRIHDIRSRVIFALVGVRGARKIFCQAFLRKMHKQKIVWILFEKLKKNWASDDYNPKDEGGKPFREIPCTPSQLMIASDGYISITNTNFRQDNVETVNGLTMSKFQDQIINDPTYSKCYREVGAIYDTVWMVSEMFRNFGKQRDIFDFKYNTQKMNFDKEYITTFMRSLLTTEFEGVTGPVKFKDSPTTSHAHIRYNAREGLSDYWIHDQQETMYGQFDNLTHTIKLKDVEKMRYFTNLSDLISVRFVKKHMQYNLVIALWAFSMFGIVVSLILLGTILVLRQLKLQFYTPALTDIPVIIGCILCFAAVIIYGVDERFVSSVTVGQVCYAFIITLSVGFSVAFGSLFANVWKEYKKHVKVKVDNSDSEKKDDTNWLFYVILLAMLSSDAVFLITLGLVSTITTVKLNVSEHFSSQGLKEVQQVTTCTCTHELKYVIAVYCYKGVQLLFGVFLLYQLKKIQKKLKINIQTNDFAIYNIISISILGVVFIAALRNTKAQEPSYAIVAVCIIIATFTTLFLVFAKLIKKLAMTSYRGLKTTHRQNSYEIKGSTTVTQKKGNEHQETKIEDSNDQNEFKPAYYANPIFRRDSMDLESDPPLSPVFFENESVEPDPSSFTSRTFISPSTYTNNRFEEETVNANGILSTSGIYVGDEGFRKDSSSEIIDLESFDQESL